MLLFSHFLCEKKKKCLESPEMIRQYFFLNFPSSKPLTKALRALAKAFSHSSARKSYKGEVKIVNDGAMLPPNNIIIARLRLAAIAI